MVCGEALRSRRWRKKLATAFPTVVLVVIKRNTYHGGTEPRRKPYMNFSVSEPALSEVEGCLRGGFSQCVSSCLRSGMMLLINSPQAVKRQMRINLSRRN